jgi:RNA-binding protein
MTAVPATNPKKKSLMPSGELRRRLRGVAHSLEPVVQIGKEGITSPLIKQVTRALFDHELIKVRIGSECPSSRFEVADRLGGEPGVNVVQIVGRVVILYKRHPDEPVFEGPDSDLAPKKPAPKKAVAKKPVAKKPAGKKPVASKPAAKKSATERRPARRPAR